MAYSDALKKASEFFFIAREHLAIGRNGDPKQDISMHMAIVNIAHGLAMLTAELNEIRFEVNEGRREARLAAMSGARRER